MSHEPYDRELLLMIGEMQGDLKSLTASSTRIESAITTERLRSEAALRDTREKLDAKIDETEKRVSKLEGFRLKALAIIAAVTIAFNIAKDGILATLSKVFPL